LLFPLGEAKETQMLTDHSLTFGSPCSSVTQDDHSFTMKFKKAK